MMKSNSGAALILVLVLITLTTVTVVSALRSSAAQLDFTQRHNALIQAEQAAESALNCVFSNINADALQSWITYIGQRPAFNNQTNDALQGCGVISTHEIQLHNFNRAPAQTYTEHLDVVDLVGADFKTHQFQTWAQGKASSQDMLSVRVVQGWQITLPKNISVDENGKMNFGDLTKTAIKKNYWRRVGS